MASENRARFNTLMAPGLFAYGKEQYKRYPKTYAKYLTMRTSKHAFEESAYGSGYGLLQEKPESTPVKSDARIPGPTKRWAFKTWALMARISQEAIEDDRYGYMKQAMKQLMVSAAATRHYLAARLLMNASTTAYHVAGDLKAICASDHVRLDGGSWSNIASAADPSETSVTSAIKNFENITDHRGKRYDQKVKTIICGPTHEFTLSKILEAQLEPGTAAGNAPNVIRTKRGINLVVDGEITDGRWFLQGQKDADVGLIWFDRIKPTLHRAKDDDTGDAKFYVRMRCAVEGNDPRQIYMVPAV